MEMNHGHHHVEDRRAHKKMATEPVASAANEHSRDAGHGHAGHDHSTMIGDFERRFWISLVLSVPIMLLSEMIQHWFGFTLDFPGDRYILAALSTFVFFYGGRPFLKGLWEEVSGRAIGMMTLIGVAITVAWGYSLAVTFGLPGMDFTGKWRR